MESRYRFNGGNTGLCFRGRYRSSPVGTGHGPKALVMEGGEGSGKVLVDSITLGLVPSQGTVGHCWAYHHAIDHPGLDKGEPPHGSR